MDQLKVLTGIPDCAGLMFGSWALKKSLDHGSFFSLGRNVNEFIQIISFFERSSFILKSETVVGIVLCYSHQACCVLYIWTKLTVAFTCTSLPFTLLFSDVVVVSDLNKNFGRSTDLVKKKGTDRRICIPLFTHL